jgi:hypothetical protein
VLFVLSIVLRHELHHRPNGTSSHARIHPQSAGEAAAAAAAAASMASKQTKRTEKEFDFKEITNLPHEEVDPWREGGIVSNITKPQLYTNMHFHFEPLTMP